MSRRHHPESIVNLWNGGLAAGESVSWTVPSNLEWTIISAGGVGIDTEPMLETTIQIQWNDQAVSTGEIGSASYVPVELASLITPIGPMKPGDLLRIVVNGDAGGFFSGFITLSTRWSPITVP